MLKICLWHIQILSCIGICRASTIYEMLLNNSHGTGFIKSSIVKARNYFLIQIKMLRARSPDTLPNVITIKIRFFGAV